MMLAELNLVDVLWSMVVFFFFFIFIVIFIQVISDLFRDHEETATKKVLWLLFLIFFTPIAVLIYLLVRGPGMAERSLKAQQAAQAQFDAYVKQTAGSTGGGNAAEQIAQAKQLLDTGAITQAEFDALKAKALA